MENVIDVYMNEAERARAWHLILRYQWVINSYETRDADVLDGLNIMKEREAK